MDKILIQNWNRVVPRDGARVWVIGDFCLDPILMKPVLNELHGKKFLILGNHDLPHPDHPAAKRVRPTAFSEYRKTWEKFYLKSGWDKVLDSATLKWQGSSHIYLRHFPPEEKTSACASILSRQAASSPTQIYFFGHVHNAFKQRGHALNVGVDVQNFRPISLRDGLLQLGLRER